MKLDEKMILLNQHLATKDQAIRLAGKLLVDNGYAEDQYIDSMLKRNEDVSTYMGNFIAIPHGTEDGKKYIKKTGISIVQVPMGIDFSDKDNEENIVTIIFGIAGLNGEHLNILSQIALFCSNVNNVVKLADAQTPQKVIDLLKGVETK